MYGQLSNIMETARLQSENAKLKMRIQEGEILRECRYKDLNAKLDALCYHLGVKIEKQDGYTVIKK